MKLMGGRSKTLRRRQFKAKPFMAIKLRVVTKASTDTNVRMHALAYVHARSICAHRSSHTRTYTRFVDKLCRYALRCAHVLLGELLQSKVRVAVK